MFHEGHKNGLADGRTQGVEFREERRRFHAHQRQQDHGQVNGHRPVQVPELIELGSMVAAAAVFVEETAQRAPVERSVRANDCVGIKMTTKSSRRQLFFGPRIEELFLNSYKFRHR